MIMVAVHTEKRGGMRQVVVHTEERGDMMTEEKGEMMIGVVVTTQVLTS